MAKEKTKKNKSKKNEIAAAAEAESSAEEALEAEASPKANRTEDEVISEVEFAAEGLDYIEEPTIEDDEDTEAVDLSGSELEGFESAEIEEKIFVDEDQMFSIIESILFSTDRPVSVATIKSAFKGTNINTKKIRKALDEFSARLADAGRGVFLEEISGGYQLRTKQDNVDFLKAIKKERPFKLSGPALEVLAIVAYEQPCIKARVDEIRAVESGHLMRALMDKGILMFAGKSELPGKPMLYKTTKKFLEIFGLKNLAELPSLDEIDNLIPEGIGEEEDDQTLGELTEGMGIEAGVSYSESEGELLKISDDLSSIDTSTDFFEQEKQREKDKRDRERAEDIRMALEDGEDVEPKDQKWLERYEAKQAELQAQAEAEAADEASEPEAAAEANDEAEEPQTAVQEAVSEALSAFDESERE